MLRGKCFYAMKLTKLIESCCHRKLVFMTSGGCDRSSSSPHDLPNNSVRSLYSLQSSWLGGASGAKSQKKLKDKKIKATKDIYGSYITIIESFFAND